MGITEDQNKWKDMSLCEKAQYCKDRILLRLNLLCISSKNSNVILVDTGKMILKFIWKIECVRLTKTFLKRINEDLPKYILELQSCVLEQDQIDRLVEPNQRPEITLCIYYRGGIFQIEKYRLFNIFIYKNFRIQDINIKYQKTIQKICSTNLRQPVLSKTSPRDQRGKSVICKRLKGYKKLR